jgi:tRNA modification GTPase
VGKSSLLNRLAGDDLAIVTPIAGTTRDALRSTIQIEGIPLHIIDTAGLRETDDEVEKIGIARSWQEIERADAVLLLVDARTGVSSADRAILDRLPKDLKRVTVYNKIDLSGNTPERHDDPDSTAISLSARSGEGVELLRQELLRIAGWHQAEDIFIARERHLRVLSDAQKHILVAQNIVEGNFPALEFFAEELRLAQKSLGQITGEFTPDDLLGVIFSQFCIGK